jgi:hypothetical protein
MRKVCVLRHLSLSTQQTYTHWLRRYGLFFKDRRLVVRRSAD